jgi:hypothetical protein
MAESVNKTETADILSKHGGKTLEAFEADRN